MQFWQVSAGGQGREYRHEFLNYGMAFVGGSEQTVVMRQVKKGDCMILKDGQSTIIAAGLVVEREKRCGGHARDDQDPTKEWLLHYDGWSLPAYCFVDWQLPERPIPTSGLVRAAIREAHQGHIQGHARSILATGQRHPTSEQPSQVRVLNPMDLLSLVAGSTPDHAAELRRFLDRTQRLISLYDDQWHAVREHETRTFLVVPFLLALGWKEEQIKIELPVKLHGGRGRADIACYTRHYTKNSKDAALIIETKGYSLGLSSAGRQAGEYASALNCDLAVATNGYSFKVYRMQGSPEHPKDRKPVAIAYLNLVRPTERCPLNPKTVGGASEALRYLLPPGLAKAEDDPLSPQFPAG